jgi:hypothetical protein
MNNTEINRRADADPVCCLHLPGDSMGVLDWLDPTRTWPAVAGPAPALNRLLLQFDALRFGAPIDAARLLGRPDAVNWTNRFRKNCELFYASKRLRLRFNEGRLCDVTFLIAPSPDEQAPFIHKNGVVSDFDFNQAGRLIRWSLYPDD